MFMEQKHTFTAFNSGYTAWIESDDDTPHSDTKCVHLSGSRESSATADSNLENASPKAAPSVLGQPTTVDTLLLNPLNSFEITADAAALHELLMPAAYERITNYEIAIGVDFQLENLAIANPADYELRGNIVFPPANIPVSRKKDDSIQWDTFGALPIYDARSVDFDIKNFQCLPKYDGELDSGMVVMVMFTLGHYSVAEGEKLSLNVQAAVAMHNAVLEEDRPSETIIDAKFPLPVN
ncbi:hypothetical protein DFH08DRAFT_977759 [Mycena albidolilacea]|uniref:Uncharacterized protein n=1 Tax=Mycena albidolilacea TaxID=1033008 RepID=A0AAD7E924_9AGAR|nr:hypothetical protein DFH08DRAFT_977759 [Mycena albidolilacea]